MSRYPTKLCPNGGKVGYASPAAARRASKNLGNKIRVYKCPSCKLFHRTSELEADELKGRRDRRRHRQERGGR